MGANDTLRPRQRKAIEALITTGNVSEAAKVAGVSRKTIYRWLKTPAFREALSEAEDESLATLGRELGRLDANSIEALKAALEDAEKNLALRASDVHLKHRARVRELLVGTKSEVSVGLDENTRKLFVQIGMLAASCITDSAQRERFERELNQMIGEENG